MNKSRRTLGVFLLAATMLAGGCTVGPNYQKPQVDVEGTYGETFEKHGGDAAMQPSRTTSGEVETQWWHTFRDPELDHLVSLALAENLDLQIATARILQARAQRSITAADLFPELDADTGYNHARGSKNVTLPLGGSGGSGGGSSGGSSGSSGGSSGKGVARPLAQKGGGSSGSSGEAQDKGSNPFSNTLSPFGAGGLPGHETSLYQVGFDATWEIDVFGGHRRELEAAAADLGAAVESRRDTMVTLLAEVARNYVELRGAQARLAVARQSLAAGRDILDLTHSIQKSGLTTALDVARSAGQVATTAATLPPLEAQVRRSMHALAILVAQNPDSLESELEQSKPVSDLPPEVPVGLPSDLLLRRPDIRQAERRIAAANARVGNATADLFPKFGLTGSVGVDATQLKNLFDWQSRYFLVSPTVTWPIFDAGRIVSNISLQKGNRSEAILVYRKTVLTALQEVEDSLVAYGTEQARHKALEQVLKQDQDALEIARAQYSQGLADFLGVLDAERNLFGAQDQLAQSTQMMTTNLVAVYKALGGGWETEGPQH